MICGFNSGDICQVDFSGKIKKKWNAKLGPVQTLSLFGKANLLAVSGKGQNSLGLLNVGETEPSEVIPAIIDSGFSEEGFLNAQLALAAYLVEH